MKTLLISLNHIVWSVFEAPEMNTTFDAFEVDFILQDLNYFLDSFSGIENGDGPCKFTVILIQNSVIEHVVDKVINELCCWNNFVTAFGQTFIDIILILHNLCDIKVWRELICFFCQSRLDLPVIFQKIFHRFNLAHKWIEWISQLMRNCCIDHRCEFLFGFHLIIQYLIWHVYQLNDILHRVFLACFRLVQRIELVHFDMQVSKVLLTFPINRLRNRWIWVV